MMKFFQTIYVFFKKILFVGVNLQQTNVFACYVVIYAYKTIAC